MNSALTALLRGNNTTISIAHRLSTIKRSDTIIVLGPDGRVAEQGSYEKLSARPDGAFTKLMEWQMSGGEVMDQLANTPANPVAQETSWDLQSDDGTEISEDTNIPSEPRKID